MRPNVPSLSMTTDRAFDACLSSHSWLETILLADRTRAAAQIPSPDEYTPLLQIKPPPF